MRLRSRRAASFRSPTDASGRSDPRRAPSYLEAVEYPAVKNAHIVPRSYLKHFAADDEKTISAHLKEEPKRVSTTSVSTTWGRAASSTDDSVPTARTSTTRNGLSANLRGRRRCRRSTYCSRRGSTSPTTTNGCLRRGWIYDPTVKLNTREPRLRNGDDRRLAMLRGSRWQGSTFPMARNHRRSDSHLTRRCRRRGPVRRRTP